MSILVTGATGQLGKAVVDQLLQQNYDKSKITAIYRDESKTAALKETGINLVKADFQDYESLVKAFTGIDQLVFVSSSDVLNRSPQHANVVKAAAQAGIKHIVYTGFEISNETESSPFWIVTKAHVETETLFQETKIPVTTLRNGLYMDFIPLFVGEAVKNGTIYFPGAQGKVSYALRKELGEAAANVALDWAKNGSKGKLVLKTWSVTNENAWDFNDIAKVLTEITGKAITYVSPSLEEYTITLAGFGVPAQDIGVLASVAGSQQKDEFVATSTEFEVLLGRKPTQLKEFLNAVFSTPK